MTFVSSASCQDSLCPLQTCLYWTTWPIDSPTDSCLSHGQNRDHLHRPRDGESDSIDALFSFVWTISDSMGFLSSLCQKSLWGLSLQIEVRIFGQPRCFWLVAKSQTFVVHSLIWSETTRETCHPVSGLFDSEWKPETPTRVSQSGHIVRFSYLDRAHSNWYSRVSAEIGGTLTRDPYPQIQISLLSLVIASFPDHHRKL